MIAFGAGYGTREMIARRQYRRYEQSQMEAYYAPTPDSLAKSGPNVKEPIVKRWTRKAMEVVDYWVT
jgi:hypothetical protein